MGWEATPQQDCQIIHNVLTT